MLWWLLLILLVGLAILAWLLVGFICGFFSGSIVQNLDRVSAVTHDGDVGACYDALGES